MKATGLRNLQVEIHLFLRWMVYRGYEGFGSIPVSAVDGSFVDYLVQQKVGNDDEDGLTTKGLARYIGVPIRLHQQAPAMPEGSRLLGAAPFGCQSASKKDPPIGVQSGPPFDVV